MPTYGERELEFVKGRGCYLFTSKNEKYLDFGGGIAVNSLGHCHPKLIKALNQFSNLGSGFNIAMRDLDIRGAGYLLGADQSGFINEIGFDMYQKILNECFTPL